MIGLQEYQKSNGHFYDQKLISYLSKKKIFGNLLQRKFVSLFSSYCNLSTNFILYTDTIRIQHLRYLRSRLQLPIIKKVQNAAPPQNHVILTHAKTKKVMEKGGKLCENKACRGGPCGKLLQVIVLCLYAQLVVCLLFTHFSRLHTS